MSGTKLRVVLRWLADQGQLILNPDTTYKAQQDVPTGLLTTLLHGGYRIEVYSTFAMLSELGYIVRTRRPQAPTADLTTGAASFSAASLPRPAKRQRLLDKRETASVAVPAGEKSCCSEPAAGALQCVQRWGRAG